MNDQELTELIRSHYQNQAQTLTSGAQANLLKLDEIMGTLEGDRLDRWNDIKRTFQRNLLLGTADDGSQMGKVLAQMTTFSEGLHGIESAMNKGIKRIVDQQSENDPTVLQNATLQQVSQAVLELAKFNQGLEKLLVTFNESATKAVAGSEEPKKAESQTIQVINRIPPVFLDVIRNQFSVLQTWIEPIIVLAATHPEAKKLLRAAELTQKNYERLINRVDETENPATESDEE